jgi:cytochrome c peroxidase
MNAISYTRILVGMAVLVGCRASREAEIDPAALVAFAPLPASFDAAGARIPEARVALGRQLYYETRLSRDHDLSCNSCHRLTAYGVDGAQFSRGVGGRLGSRNAPSVYNAAGHVAQFWDGRAATVEAQAKGPILNPVEMAMPDSARVIQELRSLPAYRTMFATAFPEEAEPVTYDNVGRAIGAFERRLLTPSRWDRYLAGDRTALTPAEQHGFRTFVDAGCGGCHFGAFVGGSIYQKLGLAHPWGTETDPGRSGVTHRTADRMVFKVASLRNVAQTSPYFHDGSVTALDDAIRMMGYHEVNRRLTADQVAAIGTWLRSLTGELPGHYITPPPPVK